MIVNSIEIDNIAKNLVDKYILAEQGYLVSILLMKDMIDFDDCYNLYSGNNKNWTDLEKVTQWFSIDNDWFIDKLKEIGAVVIETDYGTWWGRTTFGQALYYDGEIQLVAKKHKTTINNLKKLIDDDEFGLLNIDRI